MEICNNCNIQMEGGYSLKSNTYGKMSLYFEKIYKKQTQQKVKYKHQRKNYREHY